MSHDAKASQGRLWHRAVTVVFETAVLIVISASAAAAAGNPKIDANIVSHPIEGWITAPPALTQTMTDNVQKLEVSGTSLIGVTPATAAEAWVDPGSGARLFIVVIALTGKTTAFLDQITKEAASSGAASFCAGATSNPPQSDAPFSAIPDSHQVACIPVGSTTITALVFPKANELGLVGGSNLADGQLTSVAVEQYDALPSHDVTDSNGGDTAVVVVSSLAAAALLSMLTVVVVFLRRRRTAVVGWPPATANWPGGVPIQAEWTNPGQSSTALWASVHEAQKAPSAPEADVPTKVAPDRGSRDMPTGTSGMTSSAGPGWYREPTDMTRIFYWDGIAVVARKRWDGSNWVD